ncbi:putative serine/threonine-protein kinase PBL28 [Bidens hawaiensis]|uniref:putative serine/threonine-protein kinase PBL28 n=1 Tax=Bidens hawaiensis TaxID=980011 RepID=UPI00404B2828
MSSTTSDTDKLPSLAFAQTCHHFSLVEIRDATNDFDENQIIGHGGFGKVYRGQLCSKEGNHNVAVKRLDSMSNQGEPEFKAELQMLSQLRHRHLVSLIGFCDDNKEMILVYKYMSNGTLYYHLHKATTPLSWVQRLKIGIDAGLGLIYLHTGVGTHQEIIHRDVKSSNILLDEKWEAMISDFGLSKIRPTNQSLSYLDASVKGTFGYLDPEYYYTSKLTTKTDVYAFGVVLFELLSGRLAVDERNGEDHCSLVRWAQKCIKDRKLDQMIDINIRGTIRKRCLRGFAKIADRCVCGFTKERPSMTEVVELLQDLLEQQEKANMSAMLPGGMGFPSKILKYLVPESKPNSEQRHKSVQNNLEETNQRTIVNRGGSYHGEMLIKPRKLVTRKVEQYAYGELEDDTGHFGWHRRLGFGFNGTVYRGWLNTGSPIAVRNLDGYKHFDLQMYKEFQHPNLVQLIGYCKCGRDLYLVYEYMCNGNFEDLLRRLVAVV